MTLWLIEPRDPLLVRDGRPFSAAPGARADSLDFPYPSTIAGALRTRAWSASGLAFEPAQRAAIKQIALRGPLLVELSDEGPPRYFAPSPADAVFFAAGDDLGSAHLRRLAPQALPAGAQADLDNGEPIGMAAPEKAKPLPRPPRFWHWRRFEEWLLAPDDIESLKLSEWGHAGPGKDSRVHVAIRSAEQTAEEGRLFQTRGLEFSYSPSGQGALSDMRRLGLAIAVEGAGPVAEMPEGLGVLGGEQRLARWRKRAGEKLPSPPHGLREQIIQSGACRLILLTPALFAQGALPTDLLTLVPGLQVTVAGYAVPRFQVVSGWDYLVGKPKPTRRLAPAGSVYFLRLSGQPEAIKQWFDKVWMQNVSDQILDEPTTDMQPDGMADEPGQANRDGFGLAALGVWRQ